MPQVPFEIYPLGLWNFFVSCFLYVVTSCRYLTKYILPKPLVKYLSIAPNLPSAKVSR